MQEKEKLTKITEPKKRQPRAKISLPASAEDAAAEKKPRKKSDATKKAPSTRKKTAPPRKRATSGAAADEQVLRETQQLGGSEPLCEEDLLAASGAEIVEADEPEFIPEAAPTKRRSAFHLRRSSKNAIPEEDVPVLDLIHRRSGLSEEDVTMMFELGYENELGRVVGHESMKKLRTEHLRRHSHSARRHYRTAFGYRGEEYVSTKQNQAIRAAYATDRRQLLLRILLSALLSIVILLLEAPTLLGETILAFIEPYPLLLPIAAVACLLLSAALSWKRLYAGARSLMHFTPTPYSIASIVVPATAICSLLTFIPDVHLAFPVNFSASLLLLILAIGDGFRIMGEIRAFRILSAETEKTVLETAPPRKKKLLRGNKVVQVINEGLDENQYRVRRAEQTTGFFRRVNALEFAAVELSILIGASFAFALLLSLITWLARPTMSDALTAFATAILLSAPISIIITFFYPLARANAVLEKRNCALIGDEAAVEYADDQTVIFNDVDLYSAQSHTRISVRDGDEFRQDIRLAEAVFRRLGGTLKGLGVSGSRSYQGDPEVSFVRIAESGLEAMVDNDSHVLLGSADFLRRSGIPVARESTDVEARRTKHIGTMYVAINGVLRLCYEIRYAADLEFEESLQMLVRDGTQIAIRSFDPNLTDEFLQASCISGEPVSVIRPGRYEADAVQEVVDTGAVALGRRRDIALPLHAAKRIHTVRRRGFYLQILASAAGAAASVVLLLVDRSGSLAPYLIPVYHTAWSIVAAVTARFTLRTRDLDR